MLHFNITLYHLFSLDSRIVSLPASAFNLRTTETFFVRACSSLKLRLSFCFAVCCLEVVLQVRAQAYINIVLFSFANLISHGGGHRMMSFTAEGNSWYYL